jgi:photosystem II stability/assembly factor-like uncharacterized protein
MKRIVRTLFISALLTTAFQLTAAAQNAAPASVHYKWKSVQMVGGGFVDGIIFHPTAKGVRYARTDMGGAYRWNDKTNRWEPILDWIPYKDVNLMGVESIALDPNAPDRVYLACGTYTNPGSPNGAILRSSDRGKTFQRTDVPFKFGGNENGRGNGERMAVDPNDGRVLFLGTRHDGLWTSRDRGATWNRVESFPDVSEPEPDRSQRNWWEQRGSGIVVTVFDPKGSAKGRASSTIYVAVSLMDRDNLFRSNDGGKTWQAVPGQPTQYRPTHAVLATDGTLYISYGTNPGPGRMSNGAVWKLNTTTGEWTDITPDKPTNTARFGYAAVSVDAHNPQVVIASSFGRYAKPGAEDDMFRSVDGGKTWKPVFGSGGTLDPSLAPYVAATPIHWLFDIEIDPLNPDHAMFTTGYGGWETFNLGAMDSGKPTKWTVMATGIEETVALELVSPPRGAPLISAIGDYAGFVHWDLDKPAPEGEFNPPYFDNTSGVACAENKPEVIVRVGRASQHHHGGNIGYSLDGGKTWAEPASAPSNDSRLGSIAVSSDGVTWVWAPERRPVVFTRDRGATWKKSEGVPSGTRVIADRVNPQKFYAMELFDGRLFVSDNGAATFTETSFTLPDGLPQRGDRGDDRGGQDRLYSTPGREGDLWLAAFNGLYRTTTGKTFTKLSGVEELHAFGFGKAAPGADYPALYLVGTVHGQRGVFRSDDTARSWVRINDDRHQWGLVLQITGDPKQYGRVYVGTHGRGVLYGDPSVHD